MCYSAQVLQQAKKMARDLGLVLDYAEFEKLFTRQTSRNGPTSRNDASKRPLRRTGAALPPRIEQEIFSQKTRLVNAERSRNSQETKKAREDVRIATNKIEYLTSKPGDLPRTEPRARDNRIFTMVYAGIIVGQDGRNLLTPMHVIRGPYYRLGVQNKGLDHMGSRSTPSTHRCCTTRSRPSPRFPSRTG